MAKKPKAKKITPTFRVPPTGRDIRDRLLATCRELHLDGAPDNAITDGLMTLGTDATVRMCGRAGAAAALRDFADKVERGDKIVDPKSWQ